MRVLHLISSGGMYGAEAVILNLSQEVNAGGLDRNCLGIFAHKGQPTPALHHAALRLDVPSELLPCKGQMDRSVLTRMRDLVKRGGIDVVHAHGYKADIYAYLAFGKKTRPALVSTCHTWYDNDVAVRIYGAADRWVLRSYHQVVAVSSEVRDRLFRAGVPPERIHLIRNGICVTPFAHATEVRSRRAAAGGGLRVGLVGRLAPEKGIDIFLRAAARVAERSPDTTFVVAGDGPERAALETLIDELGLRNRAELAGSQVDMPNFYASLDLLVSASRQEGLPIALLEGMASGLALVATKAGAVPEIVLDGQTGFLVEPGDPEALAKAILELIGDADLRANFAAAGRRRATEQFSAQRMVADYMSVYEDALAGRSPAAVLAGESGASG